MLSESLGRELGLSCTCAHVLVRSQPQGEGNSWPGRGRAAVGSWPRLLGRVLNRIPVPIASPMVGRGWRWCRVWGSLPRSACPQQNPVGQGGGVNPGAESWAGVRRLTCCRSPREVRTELLADFYFFFHHLPLHPAPLPQNPPSYLPAPRAESPKEHKHSRQESPTARPADPSLPSLRLIF